MRTHAHGARGAVHGAGGAHTIVALVLGALGACGGEDTTPQSERTAPGAGRSAKTAALETGANLLQDRSPVGQIAMYLVGFHPSKDVPAVQMESHHYCDQVNEDFAQCVLYDGNGDGARMHGIEYIISERLYATLPQDERAYWHPHNYEIFSGTLRMPGLPDVAEKEALEGKINSYGKTWHVWMTGVHGRPADSLPLGPAHLAWSFNRDGEAYPEMIADRDRRMELSTADARQDRADLAPLARPQGGVNAMADQFPNASGAPAGVEDSGTPGTEPVPIITLRPPR